jgi:CRISPR-associated protein Csd1
LNDTVTIGYRASQEAHNALDWLLNKQSYKIDDRHYLVWNNGAETELPAPEESPLDFFPESDRELLFHESNTGVEISQAMGKILEGYRSHLGKMDNVSILQLDHATSGRMAVVYYQSMNLETYFRQLQSWQARCWWEQIYFDDAKQIHSYYGAPSLYAIADAVYGGKGASRSKLIKNIRTNLYPCIVEGRPIPENISQAIFNRTCRWTSFENSNDYERQLRVACAVMYEKFYRQKEGIKMTLDVNEKDRSYLFGRLLGVADVIEKRAQSFNVPNGTNAERYMTAFSTRPRTTWETINKALLPYQSKQRKNSYNDGNKQIDEIMDLFELKDFTDQALDGRFLLGYSAQRLSMNKKMKDLEKEEVN